MWRKNTAAQWGNYIEIIELALERLQRALFLRINAIHCCQVTDHITHVAFISGFVAVCEGKY